MSIFEVLLIQLPADGGPIYAETDMSRWISEPWNTWSSLALVFPAIYWAFRLKFRIEMYPFIYFCIPLLLLGGTGSVLYHASRTLPFYLYLDVLPTAILTISVGVYFWKLLLRQWWKVALIVIPLTVLRIYLMVYFESEAAVNVNYFIAGVVIFLPVLLYVRQHNYRHIRPLLFSVFCLALSLFFREKDVWFQSYLPMGSHFLWHLVSGIGAYYLALYLYLMRTDEMKSHENNTAISTDID